MGLVIRLVLALSGLLAGLLVARDAPNFGVVQAMLSLWVVLVVVGIGALIARR
ncbi:hypothetical protein JMJ55_10565 [Belnapia sp. T6]|uniref:NADH dehydrogenase subunit 6 n=1 Tax=Belnapia mucosa TaxID=2804532 RepID=A0ABS1V637_9PROT|nr:hypothetical protein [Belnapia mucosa]MBL6455768.1 hypothetical protein [Belnapia mucosa]